MKPVVYFIMAGGQGMRLWPMSRTFFPKQLHSVLGKDSLLQQSIARVLKVARPKSLTVLHMEVPCCRGFVFGAEKAIELAGVKLPLKRMMIGRNGEILEDEQMLAGKDEHCGCGCSGH